MQLSVWIVLAFCTYSLSATSFVRVLRSSREDFGSDVLNTYFNTENFVECGRVCKSNCLSYTYNQSTKECRTFSSKICRNDTAPDLPFMAFVKVDSKPSTAPVNLADCSEMDPSIYCSGVYRITPSPGVSFDVYCDFDTVNGTWTVIQNRQSGEENFFRSWASYKTGFGNLKGNFWLGNDNISNLTLTPSILRVEATSWYGDARYAQYSTFKVENEVNKYRLTVSGFSGNANYDAMALHNGMAFSTYERDNDLSSSNCADTYKGAWWYKSCYDCNLNGRDYQNGTDNFQSLVWDWFYPNIQYPHMMTTKMLVKRHGT